LTIIFIQFAHEASCLVVVDAKEGGGERGKEREGWWQALD
jgi:hypothetical protein